MKSAKAPVYIISPTEAKIGDEILPYRTSTRPVIRNGKTGKLGIHARLGSNGCFFIILLKKDGALSDQEGYWAHEREWSLVGNIKHSICYRKSTHKAGLLSRMLGKKDDTESHKAAFEWTNKLYIFPENEWRPVFDGMGLRECVERSI